MTAFDYFGEKLEYAAEFPAFAWAEFCQVMYEGEDAYSTRSTGAAVALAVACIAEKDRARFRQLSREHNAKTDDWIPVFQNWTADVAERPTGQPSDSPDGPGLTVVSSVSQPEPEVSSDPVVRGDMLLAVSRSA